MVCHLPLSMNEMQVRPQPLFDILISIFLGLLFIFFFLQRINIVYYLSSKKKLFDISILSKSDLQKTSGCKKILYFSRGKSHCRQKEDFQYILFFPYSTTNEKSYTKILKQQKCFLHN